MQLTPDQIRNLYQTHLNRQPTPDGEGFQFWQNQTFDGGMDQANQIFAGSEEAQGIVSPYDVQQMYREHFGWDKPQDGAGVNWWATHPTFQGNPGALNDHFASKAENAYLSPEQVENLYQTKLGRSPDEQGAQYWQNAAFPGGMPEAQHVFANSIEGQIHNPNHIPTDFNAFYDDDAHFIQTARNHSEGLNRLPGVGTPSATMHEPYGQSVPFDPLLSHEMMYPPHLNEWRNDLHGAMQDPFTGLVPLDDQEQQS